jgi:hypothetical protein
MRRIAPDQLDLLPSGGGLLFVDLDASPDAVSRVMDHVKGARPDAWHVCVYGSHVDAASLLAAKQAGAHRVLSRSRLVSTLQTILDEVLPAAGSETS